MKRRSERVNSDDYVVVNFRGVGSRNKVVAVGNYRAMVMKVTKGISKAGNPKLDWIFEITAGPEQGHKFQPYTTSLQPQSLWNLRAVLEALGVEVPEEELQIVFKELKGLELALTIEHETYEHKVKERIVDLFPMEELGEVEATEEEETEEEEEDSGETKLGPGPDKPEVMKREEAATLAKEVEEQTKPKTIKIEEETEEEEEEEEEEDDE